MAIHYNNTKIQHVHYNNTDVNRVYYNNKCVFGGLVEGVDYLRFEWLIGSMPVGISLMFLPVNSFDCEFTYIWEGADGNCGVFSTEGYSYFGGNFFRNDRLSVWRESELEVVYYQDGIAQPTSIIASNGSLTVNGSPFPVFGFPIISVPFNNAGNAHGSQSKWLSPVTVDGFIRYAPCKLLRPIPAELDANGIAREASECGMIDTFFGVFYGNVASSGAFSVANNS